MPLLHFLHDVTDTTASILCIFSLLSVYSFWPYGVALGMVIVVGSKSKNKPKPDRLASPTLCWNCQASVTGLDARCTYCGVIPRSSTRRPGTFDECLFRGPCRMLGRFGRVTSFFTFSTILFCLYQAWALLRPATLPLIGPFSALSCALHVIGVVCTLGVPFNFLATMLTPPGYLDAETSQRLLRKLTPSSTSKPRKGENKRKRSGTPPSTS